MVFSNVLMVSINMGIPNYFTGRLLIENRSHRRYLLCICTKFCKEMCIVNRDSRKSVQYVIALLLLLYTDLPVM